MSRCSDWQVLERMGAVTAGDLRRAVHAAGHDFALGTGVRYTADLTDCNDLGTIYRVRAWFGEDLLFDSGEPAVAYMRLNYADWKQGSEEWLWAEWQRECKPTLSPMTRDTP
jgi:hypothetical protein